MHTFVVTQRRRRSLSPTARGQRHEHLTTNTHAAHTGSPCSGSSPNQALMSSPQVCGTGPATFGSASERSPVRAFGAPCASDDFDEFLRGEPCDGPNICAWGARSSSTVVDGPAVGGLFPVPGTQGPRFPESDAGSYDARCAELIGDLRGETNGGALKTRGGRGFEPGTSRDGPMVGTPVSSELCGLFSSVSVRMDFRRCVRRASSPSLLSSRAPPRAQMTAHCAMHACD